MRTLSADLTAAQKSASATPYISIGASGGSSYTYTTEDNRIKLVKHVEEPYLGYAIIVLENSALDLPTDFCGYKVLIDYGYTIDGTGDTTGGEAAPLWVFKQFHTSKMGSLDTVLYCLDAFGVLKHILDIASLLKSEAGSAPYFRIDYDGSSFTIYDVISDVLVSAGFSLIPLGEDDSIIDALEPLFTVNNLPFESADKLIYRLINSTKSFIRAERADGGLIDNIDDYTLPEGRFSLVFRGAGRIWSTRGHNWDGELISSGNDGGTWVVHSSGQEVSCYAVAADETTLHLAYRDGGTVQYRMGTLNTDGTVTWDAAGLQSVSTGWNHAVQCSIAVDSNGYPFITACVGTSASNHQATIFKSTTKDGTWTEDGANSFPVTLASRSGGSHYFSMPVAIGSGHMLACWTNSGAVGGQVLSIKRWEGSAWNANTRTTTSVVYWSQVDWDVVAIGVDAYIALVKNSDGDARYQKLDGATFTLGTEVDLEIDDCKQLKLSANSTAGDVYLYYTETSDWVHTYKRLRDGVWESSVKTGLDMALAAWDVAHESTGFLDALFFAVYTVSGPESYDLYYAPTASDIAKFRIKYPGGYSSFDYTYISDWDGGTNHQFREFEFADHLMLPTRVWALGNRNSDGSWPDPMTEDTDYQQWDINTDWSIDEASNYQQTKRFTIAENLDATNDNLKNRAEVVALRIIMEELLGRLVAQHNCGLELYDYVEVKDIRGAAAYTVYPTGHRSGRWDNRMIVGSLVHLFVAAPTDIGGKLNAGKYDLEITLNGIDSELPSYKMAMKTQAEIEDEIEVVITPPGGVVPPGTVPPPTGGAPVGGGGGGIPGGPPYIPAPGGVQQPPYIRTPVPVQSPVPSLIPARGVSPAPVTVPAPVPSGVPVPLPGEFQPFPGLPPIPLPGKTQPSPVGAPVVPEPFWVPQPSTAPAYGSVQYTAQQLAAQESAAAPGFVYTGFGIAATTLAVATVAIGVYAAPAITLPALPKLAPLAPALAPAIWKGGSLF